MNFAPDVEEGAKKLSGKDLSYFRSRVVKAAHILAELTATGLDPEKKLRALCVGSGLGFIPYILARHTAWELYAGDVNESDLNKYPWIQERLPVSYLDATAMHYGDRAFDLVLCNHVIEHVRAWEKLVSEVHRVMQPEGVLYLATPNLYGLYRPDVPVKVFLLKILFRSKKKVPRDMRITLHMGLSLAEIERLLANFSHLENLNRTHALINCPKFLKLPFLLAPAGMYRHFSPTHVIIARK